MPPLTEPLANPRSERVAMVRSLSSRSTRERTGRMVAEGPQAVREAVRFAPDRVRDVYVTDGARTRWPEIVSDALEAGRYVHPTSDDVMTKMSPDAQGVLAILDRTETTLVDLLLAAPQPQLIVICEELADPGNAGTIIRAADAAGADGVILTSGSVDVTAPKVVRSSAGSLFHLPVVRDAGLAESVAALRAAGMTVLAADGGGEHDVETSPLIANPTVWIMGNEAHGVSEDARELADAVVSIPLRGHAESLNVAMAATLLLYASSRAHAHSHRPA